MADTLISVAEKTANSETVVRNLKNAWMALKYAYEFAEKLGLESSERGTFRDMHGALCLRLANVRVRAQD